MNDTMPWIHPFRGWRASPRSGERQFVDDEGVEWTVSEVSAETTPGARGAACLVFENAFVMRRVWAFPPAWRELDDAGLTMLSRAR